ncbi:MAG: fibrobacter succinogenes major paralogous domain-containing protein [Saprospiraceae bacterium]
MKNFFFLFIVLIIHQITIAQSGNVGIGTITPAAKLDIIGTIKITDGSQGTDRVLTSDQNGKGTWKQIENLLPTGTDGDSLASVWICCNPWMTKNLDVTTYRDGTPIPLVTDAVAWAALTTGAYCYYSNNSANGTIYGKLYNGYAVKDPRGLAPVGFHIPSEIEWSTLTNCLGGKSIAGGAMKETGTAHWANGNIGATDFSNLSALPGGYRGTQGGFNAIGQYGFWWSSTNVNTTNGFNRSLNSLDGSLTGASASLKNGYSVRCVRD